ncbi:MAG: hypothetical protein KGL96_14495, partial [Hyphomicrobiales bacterium]|nr:hypothetical protein [Hyphomicrobiales bacterium]
MGLHLALHAAYLVLQNPSCAFERIVDCEINVGMAPVGVRFVSDIDLFFLRQSKADMDFEKPAGSMMVARTFQHDATSRDSAESFLKLVD